MYKPLTRERFNQIIDDSFKTVDRVVDEALNQMESGIKGPLETLNDLPTLSPRRTK